MKENNLLEAGRWLAQAEHDLLVAKSNCNNGFWSDCCFMCQQAVEKPLKAFLFSQGVRPGTRQALTHSIGELLTFLIAMTFSAETSTTLSIMRNG